MKALAILGSPRKNMNTDVLLNKVIEGLEKKKVEVEKIILKDLTIQPCISCNACAKTGRCFIKDDMEGMYDKFDKADIVIMASPLYFNSVSSFTKIMVDRCQAFWSSKYVLNRPSIDKFKKRKGMFLCVAGSRQKENEFLGATLVIDLFFKAINTQYEYNLLVDNTDQSFVGNRIEILNKAYNIGEKLAKVE